MPKKAALARRAQLAGDIFADIKASIAESCGADVEFDIRADLETTNDHEWRLVFRSLDEDDPANLDLAFDLFISHVDKLRKRDEFNTPRFTLETVSATEDKGLTQTADQLVFTLKMAYARVKDPLLEAKEEPLDAETAGRPLGHPRVLRRSVANDKKTLFSSMFDYIVRDKLAKGDGCCCCSGSDVQRLDHPTAYYLCVNLHLMCYDCRDSWRGQRKKTTCPLCQVQTPYQHVFSAHDTPLGGDDV